MIALQGCRLALARHVMRKSLGLRGLETDAFLLEGHVLNQRRQHKETGARVQILLPIALSFSFSNFRTC